MRTIARIGFLLSLLCLPALAAVDATYYFTDYTSRPLSVKRVTVTPMGSGADYAGAQLSARPLVYTPALNPTLTNGSGSIEITNLIAGYAYKIAFSDGYSEPAITNYFGTNITGAVNGNDYKTTATSWANGRLVQAWYAHLVTGSGTAATNVVLSVSGNATIVTNSPSAWVITAGYQTNIPVASVTNAGTLAYSNSATFLTLLTNAWQAGDIVTSNALFAEIEASAAGISASTATNIADFSSGVVSNALSARLLATNTALAAAIVAATNGITSGTSGALTNNDTRTVTLTNVAFGNTNGSQVLLTNASQYVINPSGGAGLTAGRLGSGYLWSTTAGAAIMALATGSVSIYTNAVFGSTITGNGIGLTNISGTNLITGSINSNKLDAATLALLGSGGGISATNSQSSNTILQATSASSAAWSSNVAVTTLTASTVTGNGSGLTNIARATINYNAELATNTSPASALWVNRMPVPPRFWGSWNDFNGWALGSSTNWANTTNVTEEYLMTQADHWATNNYRDAGWKYIVLEEGAFESLTADGSLVVNSNRFPNGLLYLTDYIKSKGFIPGIYTAVGPLFGNTTCEGFVGTCYTNLDRHMQQFADLGFEFVFVDECGGINQNHSLSLIPPTTEQNKMLQRHRLIEAAIQKTGRAISWLSVDYTSMPNGYDIDPMVFDGQNISLKAPIVGDNWDFVTGSPQEIMLRSYTNTQWRLYSFPGHYFYQGQINDMGILTSEQRKFAFFIQTMLCGAITINSDRDRVEYVGSVALDGSLGTAANPPSTWGGVRDELYTNVLLAAIHQDPAVIPATRISSNSLAELWWRPVGWNANRKQQSDSHAVMLANLSATNQTHVVAFTNFAGGTRTFLVTDCLANTNFYATNSFSKTVVATNCYIFKLEPIPTTAATTAALTSSEVTLGFDSIFINGTGASKLTGTAFQDTGGSAGPFYATDGAAQTAANSVMKLFIPTPIWATNAQIVFACYMSNSVAISWTNKPYVEWCHPTGRALWDSANLVTITNTPVITTVGGLTWSTNYFSWPATNAPKVIQFWLQASSNSAPRWILGPLKVNFNGTAQGAW